MIDLTATKKIKTQISANPDEIQAIIDATPIGICITNQAMNYAAVNEAYCQIYKYSKEELIGNSFLIVVPEEYKEQLAFLHDKFIKEKREIARQWTVVNRQGENMNNNVDTYYSEDLFDKTPHKITFVELAK